MDASVIARVRGVLDGLGKTQAQLAEDIATTPDKLSKSLAGTRKFTATELALIAELGGTSVEWLLSGRARSAPSLAARSSSSAIEGAGDVKDVAERFVEAHEQLTTLAGTSESLKPLPTLKSTWSYVAEGNALAEEAVEVMRGHGEDAAEIASLPEAVEAAFQVDVAVAQLPESFDGCAWQDEGLRLIILSPSDYLARQRFTLAHELGHILACDAQDLIAERVTGHGDLRSEKRANTFAAAFLLPEDTVRRAVSGPVTDDVFIQMVTDFRVSPATMAWRLVNLGIVQRSAIDEWRYMTTEQCMMLRGLTGEIVTDRQRARAERIPPRLLVGHLQAYWQKHASARPLAKLLQRDPAEVIGMLKPIVAEA